jgi:hypothetical protein
MPCLLGCIALAFPRLALFLVWLFGSGYLTRAYEHWIWPLLGFIFLPLTTLTFAFSLNSLGQPGDMSPFGWVLTALAVAVDVGLLGRGRVAYQYKFETRKRD